MVIDKVQTRKHKINKIYTTLNTHPQTLMYRRLKINYWINQKITYKYILKCFLSQVL